MPKPKKSPEPEKDEKMEEQVKKEEEKSVVKGVKQKPSFDKDSWQPKTELGRSCSQGRLRKSR